MLQLIVENPGLRMMLLLLLFSMVAVAAYFSTRALGMRQVVRSRLLEVHGGNLGNAPTMASLRADPVQSNWLKLVDPTEKRGLSLVDTKDKALRQRLIAAGFTTPHAPRVYTLTRLVMVFGLPVLTLLFYWVAGSSPSILKLYATLVIAAALGLYLPAVFVRARADRRQR